MERFELVSGEPGIMYVKGAQMDNLSEAVFVDSNDIRDLVITQGHLPEPPDAISETTDLSDAGLTSVSRMNVILALEDCYKIQFPDEMLTRETFRDIRSIADAVKSLLIRCHASALFFVPTLSPDISLIS